MAYSCQKYRLKIGRLIHFQCFGWHLTRRRKMMEAESLGKAGKTVDLGNAGQAGSQKKKKGVYKIYQEK